MKERISKDIYFMQIAIDVARRSTCTRHQIGCVIVDIHSHIISTGYNGAPRGMKHCLKLSCLKDELKIKSGERQEKCRAVHAEMNALLQAGPKAQGAILYVNSYPCKICARLIINAEIKCVVISGNYSDTEGLVLLEDANINWRR